MIDVESPWAARTEGDVAADLNDVSARAYDLARRVALGDLDRADVAAHASALEEKLSKLAAEARGLTRENARALVSEAMLDLLYVAEPSPVTSLRLARFLQMTRARAVLAVR